MNEVQIQIVELESAEDVGIWRYIFDISYSIGKRFTCYSMGFPFAACYDTDVLFFYADR